MSVGYAIAYYGVAVLRWVHDPAHPHNPPSLAFLLGASTTPGKAFSAPVNTEGASTPFEPFGAASAAPSASGGTGGAGPAGPPGSGPSVLTPQGELGAIIGGLGG